MGWGPSGGEGRRRTGPEGGCCSWRVPQGRGPGSGERGVCGGRAPSTRLLCHASFPGGCRWPVRRVHFPRTTAGSLLKMLPQRSPDRAFPRLRLSLQITVTPVQTWSRRQPPTHPPPRACRLRKAVLTLRAALTALCPLGAAPAAALCARGPVRDAVSGGAGGGGGLSETPSGGGGALSETPSPGTRGHGEARAWPPPRPLPRLLC